MKRIGLAVVAALCLMHVAALPLSAQGVRWGPYAGLVMPIGNYGDLDKLGFVAGLGVTNWLSGGMIGIRVDGSYSQTSHDAAVVPGGGNTKMLGGMASAVFALGPATASMRPVVTGGIGLYNVDGGGGSETKIGFGGGIALLFKMGPGSTRLVVATRYTSVTTNPSLDFVPITVGLSFGK
jgi:hypothetical protein